MCFNPESENRICFTAQFPGFLHFFPFWEPPLCPLQKSGYHCSPMNHRQARYRAVVASWRRGVAARQTAEILAFRSGQASQTGRTRGACTPRSPVAHVVVCSSSFFSFFVFGFLARSFLVFDLFLGC